MKKAKVSGILAISTNGVIGQDDKIPWHHKADFALFKQLTIGNALLMGYPTFKGIAKHYTKQGKQVLPGRQIFIVGHRPFEGLCDLKVDLDNTVFVDSTNPTDDIETCLSHLTPEQRLFISGGRMIYDRFLPFASSVFLTTIYQQVPVDHNSVKLTQNTHELLQHYNWREVYDVEYVDSISKQPTAKFTTMTSLVYNK